LTLLSAGVAACTDLRTRTIPNWLTVPLPVVGMVGHGVMLGPDGLGAAFLGCLVCFAPAYFLFVRGALGGGDVKLFSAFGALLGPREGLELELTAFSLVALYALWSTAWRGRLLSLLRGSCRASLHLVSPARFPRPESIELTVELPMGGAIFLSALALCVRSVL
jgi:prepilin peptidase CpaA